MRLIDADWVLAALGVFNDRKHGDAHFFNGIASAKEIVEHAPTIATRDWTPCAEGLPEHCSENRVTVLDTRCGARYATNMDYNIHTKKWTNDKANELPSCYSVIAWQPLPAPYRADDTTGKAKED